MESKMKLEKTDFNGRQIYKMTGSRIEVHVCPEDGMNIYQIIYDGNYVVVWDEERFERGGTYSVPVLYPTPNRTRDLKIHVNEESYDARMHGLVRRLPFTVTKEACTEDGILLEGSLQWDEAQAEFSMFPYRSILVIRIRLCEDALSWEYELTNHESRELPYGIAIHPFFSKNNQNVEITVPTDMLMEMTQDNLPTGRLIPIEETGADLRKSAFVEELDLDHVYTGYHQGEPIVIRYEDFKLEIDCTEEFTHVVVFTPKKPFFCIENQTCATDCFNLYHRGLEEESGLLFVAPGKTGSGALKFRFSNMEA